MSSVDARSSSSGAHPAIRAALGGFTPSAEQSAAIEHAPAPLSVIAGAGSGKTAVMAARIAHLVVTGQTTPSQVLGLTFTHKAAGELEERIKTSLSYLSFDAGEEVSVFTYHGFADGIVRDFGPKIGIEPGTALLTQAQAWLLITRLLEEIVLERIVPSWLPSLIPKVTGLAGACGDHLRTPEDVLAADQAMVAQYRRENRKMQSRLQALIDERPDICNLVSAYTARKALLGKIDYGDQIAFAFKLVSQHPEVAASLRGRWPVVLLDEYQDTNVAQRKMMQAIYPPGSPITVVGDPDQAIYEWRGATLYNVIDFPAHFPQRGGVPAATRKLEVSFRSGRRILAVAEAIISEIPESQRGVGKKLHHHLPTGEGDVTCDLVASEDDEAELVAEEIKSIAGADGSGLEGHPLEYREVAILCRARSLFARLQRKLREKGIPVEVVGLAGLLTVPEVVDIVAYLKLLVTPSDNIAFGRVAMGPRWRIHYRDMAALARWAAENTGKLERDLRERDDKGGDVDPGQERFFLSEAITHAERIADLSEEARWRFGQLQTEIERARLRLRACTLADAVEMVLDETGVEDELSVASNPIAQAARANINSFLDQASAFAPLEGEASVVTFLEYLDAASEVEDLEMTQPKQDDSVKLMTVHQAKGLEFDLVFVPGMADERFPNARVTDNPMKSVSELPYSIREDNDHLPRFTSNMAEFEKALKQHAMYEERRLAYVAMTRARKVLRLSAAHWYGQRIKPNKVGQFFMELAGTPEQEDQPVRPAHKAVRVRQYEQLPEENPMKLEMTERAKLWPVDNPVLDDELFAQGWRRFFEDAVIDPGLINRSVDELKVDRVEFESRRAEVAEQLMLIGAPGAPPVPDERLQSMSVSSMVQLSRCPKQFYWTVVRPLPRRPSAAARRGQHIHRWIEIRSVGQGRLDDPEEPVDLAPEEIGDPVPAYEPAGPAVPLERKLKNAWQASRFSDMIPRFTEQPFVLALPGGLLVRGRIDAVYVHEDGTWELVDYKTGREPDAADAVARLQLAIYSLAAQEIWKVDPGRLKLTYFYLSSGRADPIPATELTTTGDDLTAMFGQVQAGRFEPRPGAICGSCDFLRFCDAGKEHVATTPNRG